MSNHGKARCNPWPLLWEPTFSSPTDFGEREAPARDGRGSAEEAGDGAGKAPPVQRPHIPSKAADAIPTGGM